MPHCNQYQHTDGCPHARGSQSPSRASDPSFRVVRSVRVGGGRIDVRSDTLHDDDLVLIHMGTGDPSLLAGKMLDQFAEYRGVETEDGLLCVSVFGVTNGVTRDDILRANPQNKYGEARYGAVKHLARLLPTSFIEQGASPLSASLQRAHFDLVVETVDTAALAAGTLGARAERALLAEIEAAVLPILEAFKPRTDKRGEPAP